MPTCRTLALLVLCPLSRLTPAPLRTYLPLEVSTRVRMDGPFLRTAKPLAQPQHRGASYPLGSQRPPEPYFLGLDDNSGTPKWHPPASLHNHSPSHPWRLPSSALSPSSSGAPTGSKTGLHAVWYAPGLVDVMMEEEERDGQNGVSQINPIT